MRKKNQKEPQNANGKSKKRITQLLSMAYNSESISVAANFAEKVLTIDPDEPNALMIKADTTENTLLRTAILRHAISSVEDSNEYWNDEEDRDDLLLALNQRLAFSLFSLGEYEELLKLLEDKLLNTNPGYAQAAAIIDETLRMKDLYYRTLVQIRAWQKILAFSMKDDEHNLGWAYSRLIATFMLSPNQNYSVCAQMFWDALILGVDVPFYMLGYFEEPDEDASPKMQEEFNFSVMFFDILSISEDFFRWFSRGTVLFGLLSGRMDNEHERMLGILDTLEGLEDYEAMNKILVERDDAAIIEMLAAHKCLAK